MTLATELKTPSGSGEDGGEPVPQRALAKRRGADRCLALRPPRGSQEKMGLQ